MRLLFVTWTGGSHLFPMVPLAWAALAAGHEVRVAAPPGCAPAITGAGLTAVGVGQDRPSGQMSGRADLAAWRGEQRWPRRWAGSPEALDDGARAVFAALADKQFAMAETMLDELMDFARAWRPDVVVHDSVAYAGAVAAAALGVPAFSHMFGSPMIMRNELQDFAGEPVPGYAKLFARLDVAPPAGPHGWIDPCPPALQWPAPVERISARFVPYNGPGEHPSWLWRRPSAPRACLTWGMTAARHRPQAMPEVFANVLTVLADLDLEIVLAVTAAHRDRLPALPPRTRVVESLPFHLLLPTCDVLVHHGGTGTGLTAVAAGVPQLMVPLAPVLAAFSERVDACGAGIMCDPAEEGDAGGLRRAVERLLTADGARRAAAVRDEVAALPLPAEVLGMIEAAR
ncbi:nucleotide disphospho-sugar-binding domain-containing protein [Dactylosporangium sp. CA-092794]|uniref:nucleotide disphospho-sugar-binding domain-containing protein n=1 Tax=Dactylosporangium sp. CA-092794 TaxID=3239929 RepID=UPI003D909F23